MKKSDNVSKVSLVVRYKDDILPWQVFDVFCTANFKFVYNGQPGKRKNTHDGINNFTDNTDFS
jgi:hypothetical protein